MTDPIQREFLAKMNALADGLDKIFNGEAKGKDRKIGFVLLSFYFGDVGNGEGRINYISNADRKEMIVAMKEWLARAEGRLQESDKQH